MRHHLRLVSPDMLAPNQRDFLHQLFHRRALPVAQFAVESSRESDFYSIALSPVFLRSSGDDMAAVKEAGAFLSRLEALGLLTLDYDIPLKGYAYGEYHTSALYAFFVSTVEEGAKQQGFLGDIPCLELGSMALTPLGERLVRLSHK